MKKEKKTHIYMNSSLIWALEKDSVNQKKKVEVMGHLAKMLAILRKEGGRQGARWPRNDCLPVQKRKRLERGI